MSFYLGSFAGGLFNGASSAFQIYNMYQGIQKTTLDLDAAQQAKDAIAGDAANKNVPGYQSGMTSAPGVQIPAGDVSGSPSSGPYVVGGVQSQGTAGTSSPATTTHSGPVNVPTREAVWGGGDTKEKPGKQKEDEPGVAGGKGITPGGYAADTDRTLPPGYALRDPPENARPPLPVDTGRDVFAPAPPAPPGPTPGTGGGQITQPGAIPDPITRLQQVTGVNPNPQAPPGGPWGSTTQQQPGGAWQYNQPTVPLQRPTGQDYVPPSTAPPAQAIPPVVPPSAQPPVAPTPPPIPGARPGMGIETPRIVPPGAVAAPAPGQVTNAGANSFTYPTPQPPPPVTSAEAMRIPTPQPPPPPQVSGDATAGAPTDGRGNYYDRAEGQWKPIPSVQTGTAPASGGAPGRGGIVSAALSAINPMGSAQAAEVTPEMKAAMPVVDSSGKLEPLAPAPNARPTTGAESTERMTEVTPDKAEPDKGIPTITVKPDPLTGQSKPATPATPEKASPKQPPQQQSSAPVPVKSGETGGKVVPDQKGNTQQSEPTNTSYAPPVNPHPYAWLKANDPEKAALIDEAVRLYGDGGTSVTADQLAAHWANESHFGYTSITSKDGAIGPLQVIEPTWRQMDPHKQFDITTIKGGLAVATLYLKHLAVDEHLGVNSVATNFGYMRGPVAAREAQADLQTAMQKYPVAFKGLQSFYPDMKLTSDQFPGSGNGSSYRDNWPQIAQQDTPDGVLHMIATTGPTGLGMTDRWMQVEGAMVAAAIAHGNYDAVQHVTDWVAQMSHSGALSNLALASSMMQSGNMEGAAGALAKAHAFFPDGTYAQFGTDAKGRLVGRQFSEKDGTPMGNAFLINNEQIMQQMLQLQNPRTYIQALQTYQKNNAEIDLAKSHAQYFRALPGLKEEAIQATRERDSARTDAQQARLDAQTQARRDKEQHDFDLQQQKQEGRVGNEDKVDTAVNTDYKERTTAARNAVTDAGDDAGKRAAAEAEVQRLGRESQISRELRVQQMHGGYGMAGPAADALAEGVTKGKYDVRSIVAKDGTKYYGVYDKGADISKSQPHALLSNDRGARIQGLAGAVPLGGGGNTTTPALPMAPKDTGSQQRADIGAGLRDPRMAGRFNTNLAGIQPVSQAA